ncbi:hypothetical protein [Microvirga rosea]|uniref:hypothetical protein n=1 Tax=Microvirga rosea TaxID=2715425 RepID=UPI001D0AAE7C|nr:hypothetical protein [Microvirga rosea]MCB8823348.1 hypothetical protein [Microvirga rosea]
MAFVQLEPVRLRDIRLKLAMIIFVRITIYDLAIINRWLRIFADDDFRLGIALKTSNSSELSLPSRSGSNLVNALLSIVAKGSIYRHLS